MNLSFWENMLCSIKQNQNIWVLMRKYVWRQIGETFNLKGTNCYKKIWMKKSYDLIMFLCKRNGDFVEVYGLMKKRGLL